VKKSQVLPGLCVVLSFVVSAPTAMAQSTIFNIPSTDTVSAKKVYGEFDSLPQAPGPEGEASRVVLSNPRVVVGLPYNTEVGVNVPMFHTSGNTAAYIEPNGKVKLFNSDDSGVAVAAGALFHTALNDREGQDSWGFVYGGVSKKVKNGPRFHAGPYAVIDDDDAFAGPRAGILVGYEQPVHKSISIVADWFSGKNYYGYFTPGVSIVMPKSGLLNVGYSFGNDSWEDSNATKNRYLFMYYGMTFN